MGSVKVRMSRAGAIALRNSQGVMDDLLSRAERMRDAADAMAEGKYDADVRTGKTRAHAMVKTKPGRTREAVVSRASNAKHNTLLKSMDAGRG